MKHLYLIAILAFIFIPKNTLSQTYIPFPTDSAEWSVATYLGSTAEDHIFQTTNYGISGDTIINSKTYHKIVSSISSTFDVSDLGNYYVAAFREENKIIYFLKHESVSEDTLYNFNLGLGDLMPSAFANQTTSSLDSIVLIDSIQLGGIYHKKYNTFLDSTNTNIGTFSNSLVEGLGALSGKRVFPTTDTYSFFHSILLCFKQNGEIKYQNEMLNTCYYYTEFYDGPNSISEPLGTNELANIYPNPSKDIFTVQLNRSSLASVTLKTAEGKTIFSQKNWRTGTSQLDMSNHPSGVYIVEIRLENYSRTYKIIKI